MKIRNIAIRGDGVAARCCAHLLARAGFAVRLDAISRPRVPAIMIGDAAAALIRDVFDRPAAFEGEPRVVARVVRWGSGEQARLDHSAVVVSEQRLLETLGQVPDSEFDLADFTIYASGELPGQVVWHSFGTRRASAAAVDLNAAEPGASCIESLANGWLFLVPVGVNSGWLLAIGDPLEFQLEQSKTIAPMVASFRPAPGEFPACPRVALPLTGPDWLACGSAALAFDPICGDGTAQAVREAILACAMIRAMAEGGDAPSLRAHYENRLLAGIQRHIALCAEFYRSGGSGAWWQEQMQDLSQGFHFCTSRLAPAGPPRYRLRDYCLEPLPQT